MGLLSLLMSPVMLLKSLTPLTAPPTSHQGLDLPSAQRLRLYSPVLKMGHGIPQTMQNTTLLPLTALTL